MSQGKNTSKNDLIIGVERIFKSSNVFFFMLSKFLFTVGVVELFNSWHSYLNHDSDKKFVKKENYSYYIPLTFTVITKGTLRNTNQVHKKFVRIEIGAFNESVILSIIQIMYKLSNLSKMWIQSITWDVFGT